jgi:predicted transcriptional regulator
MPDNQPPQPVDRELATKIVAAYVRRNQIGADQIATLISTVHQALAGLGKPAEPGQTERTPAVPIRRSVSRDYVVCLECGWRGQMLRRHIATAHGLTVEEYRARWNLPADHAITAPAYSERRSGLAKQAGLGRLGQTAAADTSAPVTAVAAEPAPRRRGRPRSTATA